MKKRKRFDIINKIDIVNHKNDLPLAVDNNLINIKTDSWFDIQQFNSILPHNNITINHKFKKESLIKCQQIKMLLTSNQKKIINQWLYCYTKMYNESITFLKNKFTIFKNDINREKLTNLLKETKKYTFCDPFYIRKQLKNIKKGIQEESQLKDYKSNTKIQIHTLDYAIRQLCSNVKSAKTNLLAGNIKRFRIKYWRNNRCSKTIDVEKQCIQQGQLCPKILGNIEYNYNGIKFELPKIKQNIKINYNSIIDEYTLLIPIKCDSSRCELSTACDKIIDENKENNLISLDPGLRTFMTGTSENKLIKIGDNVNNIIAKSIHRTNKINKNDKISIKIKKKNELKINKKIKHKVDDLHWKTINYLVKNFNIVLLGDMSAKSIVKKNKSVLSKEMKVACLRTQYYLFTQRLEYKCKINQVNYNKIDEAYTSKTCSNCGYYKKDLGNAKVYECDECKIKMNRDMNGSRNIYIKYICDD